MHRFCAHVGTRGFRMLWSCAVKFFGLNMGCVFGGSSRKPFRLWWPGTGSNRRRRPFQGRALPLSYLASAHNRPGAAESPPDCTRSDFACLCREGNWPPASHAQPQMRAPVYQCAPDAPNAATQMGSEQALVSSSAYKFAAHCASRGASGELLQ
jgi:hypothetical protein